MSEENTTNEAVDPTAPSGAPAPANTEVVADNANAKAAPAGVVEAPVNAAAPVAPVNPIQQVVDNADVTGATAHHVVADLIQGVNQLAVRAQIAMGIAQKIYFQEVNGIKGQIQAFLQYADEDTLDIVHKLLGSRVTIPEPVAHPQDAQAKATAGEAPVAPVVPEGKNILPFTPAAPAAEKTTEA